MSRVMQRRWPGNPDALSRRGRLPCDYEAYVPDPLRGRPITLDGDVAADVADAEAALVRLDVRAATLADTRGTGPPPAAGGVGGVVPYRGP